MRALARWLTVAGVMGMVGCRRPPLEPPYCEMRTVTVILNGVPIPAQQEWCEVRK